jgi:Leucine-rich repeat (LRR) protein
LPPPQSARWLGELPQLEALNLHNNYLSDADLKILGNLRNLRKLIVTDNPLTEAAVTTVAGLTHLEELALGSQRFACSDATLEQLAGLRQLRSLRLLGSYETAKISPKGLKALAALKDLHHLTLCCAPMAEPDWNSLAGLEELYLYSWPKSPWPGSGLAALKNLRKLGTYAIDAKAIAQLDSLEELTTHASDEAVRHFGNLKKLRTLKLGGSGESLTDTGLAEIAKLKQLHCLELRNVAISDMGLKRLTALPNLVELDIGANPQFTAAGLRSLSDCKALRRLSVSTLHQMIDVPTLEVLAELRQLRELDLGGRFDEKLSAQQAEILAGCRHLKRLGVSYTTQQEQEKLRRDLPSCYMH